MKDDLNKPEDKKQKQPKFEKKSTDQRMQATPPVDNSGEEEIPEWKSSIRREPVQEEQPERKMPVINKKYMIAAAAVVVLGAAAFGVAPRLMKDPETKKQIEEAKKQAAQEETASADESQESAEQGEELQADEAALKSGTSNVTETTDETDISSTGQQDSKADGKEKIATPPITGLAHAESYESLYEILHKWQSDSNNWNAADGARGIELYSSDAETDMVSESTADAVATEDSSAAMYPSDIDSGFTYDESQESTDHSTTNTQEENVDEADIVKTDGTYIYAMNSRGDIRIVDAVSMKLVSEISGDRNADYMEMYLNGDSLQVIRQQETYITYKGDINLSSSDSGDQETNAQNNSDSKANKNTDKDSETDNTDTNTVRASYSVPVTTVSIDTYDISDRENPKQTGTCQQDGTYLSSRRNGGNLYLFTSYSPDTTDGVDAKVKYIPRIDDEYIAYDHIYLPAAEETTDYTYDGKNYLVASSVSDENPDQITDSMAVVSGAETFYVSESNIYSAVSDWTASDTKPRTEIVRIGYEDGFFTEGSTGSVSGELNNSFSMDEYNGNLRLVTTTAGWNKDYSEYTRTNGLYILDADMKTIGKIENLADNEEIKSARFMGDTGYFVTYRNTDPLFSADLSDPTKPKIIGELKITGFSEYLHFYGENKLLGIGWETDPDTGSIEGLKCSMFDITDPSDVKEIDRIVLKNVSICDALSNYRAILASPDKNLFGFAYGLYKNSGTGDYYHTEEQYYYGLLSYSEEDGFVPGAYLNITQSGLFDDALTNTEYRTMRGIYISDTFYLVTENGISSYDMTDGYKLTDTLLWES